MAVPWESYIAAGCLRINRHDGPSGLQNIWHEAELVREWHFAVHDYDALDVADDDDERPTLPPALQAELLQTPHLATLKQVFDARRARFAFRISSEDKNHGFVRVYLLPDDEGRNVVLQSGRNARKTQQALLALVNSLDFAPQSWQGEYDENRALETLQDVVSKRQKRETDDEHMSLLQMFNTIPSPQPQPGLIQDYEYQMVMDSIASSKIRGLKSTLYGYQSRSAAVMLQRELCPGRITDPRMVQLADQNGRAWYYDDAVGELLLHARYYDGPSGGILAEEMGTGKTLICLALILATKAFPAEIPEVSRARGEQAAPPRRPRVGSLADMAAAVITHESVPWKLYLDDPQVDCERSIAAIKRNPGMYHVVNRGHQQGSHQNNGRERLLRRSSSSSSLNARAALYDDKPVYLTSCNLVVVPPNLVRQWQQEIAKHTEGLKVLVLAGTGTKTGSPSGNELRMPSREEIAEADILLVSMQLCERMALHIDLPSVHFKRVIVDEGHRLGNSRMSFKSNLLTVLESLHVSFRWIVTGTPSTGLFGVDDTETPAPASGQSRQSESQTSGNNTPTTTTSPPTTPLEPAKAKATMEKMLSQPKTLAISSSAQERKDLERIGSMTTLYLRVRPWANRKTETEDRPADWAVYVMQPEHSSRSAGRRDCLRSVLNALIIRHRKAEIGSLLPPVVEQVVLLDGSYQDKLCLGLFSMMIVFNAVQSQRTDQDYFFHPKQRSALLQLVRNMRQATFFGAYFYAAHDIAKAVETAETFLEQGNVPISPADDRLLRDAIAFGKLAKTNRFKRMADQFHEIPIFVRDFPVGRRFAKAWSMDDGGDGDDGDDDGGGGGGDDDDTRLTCTAAPLIRTLQQFLRPCVDAPHSLQAMFDDGRFVEKGKAATAAARRSGNGQSLGTPDPGTPDPNSHSGNGSGNSNGNNNGSNSNGSNGSNGSNSNRNRNRNGHNHSPRKATPTLAGNTKLGQDTNQLKRGAGALGAPSRMDSVPIPSEVPETAIAEPLARAQIVSTSSAKLSYLLDAIVRFQDDEQIIVFYDNENTAFYLAEHLEILQIHHLIYARGISTARRAHYVDSFNHNPKFRVLLMDISQAAFGLDMRSASRVYFVNPVLNPQVEAQAIGRVRRISQQRQVSVETLVLRDSLEEVILARRQTMTQAEHRLMKSILDDKPIYEWILHAQIQPLIPEEETESQMAPLRTPQFLFGRGFGRVEHPDEGLVQQQPNSNQPSGSQPLTNGEKRVQVIGGPPRKKAKLTRPRVKFAVEEKL